MTRYLYITYYFLEINFLRIYKTSNITIQINAFKYALHGIIAFYKKERHAKIHFCLALTTIITCIYFKISWQQWVAIIICIAMVFVAEMFNSAIEKTIDFVCTQKNAELKYIKDVAAAAVLIAAAASTIIAVIILLPKIIYYVTN